MQLVINDGCGVDLSLLSNQRPKSEGECDLCLKAIEDGALYFAPLPLPPGGPGVERVVLAKFWGRHPLHERSRTKPWEVIMREGRIMVMVTVTVIIMIMTIVIIDS